MTMSVKRENQCRELLPYGIWTLRNGGFVLFNRNYVPIWIKEGGEPPKRMYDQRVPWVGQIHLFRDGNPPWKNKHTFKICVDLLETLGMEDDLKEWML